MKNTKIRVGVIGVSGYTGKEVFSLLLSHPNVRMTYVAANNTQGLMGDIYPEFLNRTTLVNQSYKANQSNQDKPSNPNNTNLQSNNLQFNKSNQVNNIKNEYYDKNLEKDILHSDVKIK